MSTTYTSFNSRPCPDCGLKRCPDRCNSVGLLTSVIPSSSLTDSYVISQDVSVIQQEARALEYLQATVPVVDVRQHPSDYVTMTGVLEAFDNQPQGHARQRAGSGWYMFACMAAVFVGIVLVTFGLVFNAETTRLVWSLITGK